MVGVLIKIVEPTLTTAVAGVSLLFIELTSIVAWNEKLSKLEVCLIFNNCDKSTENATFLPSVGAKALNATLLHGPTRSLTKMLV